jgi:hypothetical protein
MNALKILRIKEWWGYKVPMLLAVFVLFYDTSSGTAGDMLLGAGILIWWTTAAAAFGYMINNIFDIEQDRLAGKPNFTAGMSGSNRILTGVLLAAAALVTWLVFFRSLYLFSLAFIHLFLFLIYSIPPLRLKERGYAGILTDACYAYCLPVIIALGFALAYGHKQISFAENIILITILWSLAAGARSILLHHFKDRKADKISNTFNVVNAYGLKTNSRLINIGILPVELLCFYFLLSQQTQYPLTRIFIFSFYLLLITFTMTRFGLVWNFKRRFLSMRFSPTQFYEGWFLLVNLSIAALSQSAFLIFIPIQIVLFQNEVFQFIAKICITLYAWVKAFYFAMKRLFKPLIVNSWHHIVRPVISFLVNYSIYYFRKLILRQTESEATTPLSNWRKNDTNFSGNAANGVQTKTKQQARKATEVWARNAPLSDDNRIVNGLWIGRSLSHIEQLTVRSFMASGHTFRLWVYEPVDNVPAGVEVCDANTIIPSGQIFRYKYANAFGHGKGSVSGFSDVFRYKLLYDQGGWWVDMDICCIHPFQFDSPYFFRTHHDLDMVGNIMKCPKGSQLMWDCYTEAKETVDENNTDWHKPIEILNRHIVQQDLSDFIFRDFSNEDKWGEIKQYIFKNTEISPDYVALHWMNEEWRSRGINKNDIRYNSRLGQLLVKYDIIKRPGSGIKILANDLRHLIWVPVYDRLKAQ